MGLSSNPEIKPSENTKSNNDASQLDDDLANLEGENAKIDLLLEKMDILAEEIVPEKLAKFKEHIDEHQKIFEAKIKKQTNDKMDKNAKGVKEGEKRAEKMQKAL